MKTRGEKSYINLPSFVAKFYDNLTSVKGVNIGSEEIASFKNNFLKQGRLLDIGTGPGRLLYEIHKKSPQLELYGLDISPSMLDVAKRNLKNIKNVDLQLGNIAKTEYQDNFFDCIVCSGTFYLWDKPVEGLNEIFRILKSGKTAYLFESNKDYDKKLLNSKLEDFLREYNFSRKILTRYFLRKQLRMTYSIPEVEELIKQSRFGKSYNILQIELRNLPIYLRIELRKAD
jgi:ubiquinone/menaquinone biosynthesis C-methylase UbiE